MGTDNDGSNRRAKEELGWKTRAAIEIWVREEYKPPK